jgi:cytochrome c oxidase subunit IV
MAEHVTGHHSGHHHAPDAVEQEGGHHVVPVSLYLRVFAALMVLLVLTLVAAMFNLGEWNIVIAVTIAVIKALLVALYFMHLRWGTRLVQLFGAAALFWLAIMFALTLGDYWSRHGTYLPLG